VGIRRGQDVIFGTGTDKNRKNKNRLNHTTATEGLTMKSHRPATAIVFTVLIIVAQFVSPGTNESRASNSLEALSEEQLAFANRFSAFLDRVDALYFGRIEELNGGLELETRTMSSEYSDYDIKVARGAVIEKGGRTLNITKKPTRSFQRDNLWSRYYLLDVHPESPLVGMLHAAIVIQFFPDDTATIGGFLDVLETANREEDLAYMKQAMDQVYEKYGVDPAPSRRRKTTKVGGSFYLAPLMSVTEKNFSFMTEAYETMLEAYLTVVERRMNDPYTDQDLAAQDAMRKNWLEDRFFSDPFTTSVTPYEAWSLYSLPPEVKF
jgi:coproporphyrinogen III oxidase